MVQADIEKAFETAAAIAKKLPENLQEAAFNRALDHLLNTRAPTASKPRSDSWSANALQNDDDWVNAIDRTRYADIGATTRVADQALKILQLAQADHGIDGLTAPQIARVLIDKFRLRVSANAVSVALQRERGTVNARRGPAGITFHLMAAGERYLDKLRQREPGDAAFPTSSRRKSRLSTKGKSSRSAKPDTSPVNKPVASHSEKPAAGVRRRSGRPGPKAAVADLVHSGFFDKPRGISDVQEELKHKRGHVYTLQELSPALVRSLRDHTVDRKRNELGQYEYFKA